MQRFTNVTAAPVLLRRGFFIQPGQVLSADSRKLRHWQMEESAQAIPALSTLAGDPMLTRDAAAKILANVGIESDAEPLRKLQRIAEAAERFDVATLAEAAEKESEQTQQTDAPDVLSVERREGLAFEMRQRGDSYAEIADFFDVAEGTARRYVRNGGK